MCLFSLLLKCSALSANTWFKTVILTKGLSHQLVYSCHTNVQTHRAKTTWFSQLTSAVGCTPIGVHTCRKIGLRPKRCSSIAQSSTVVSRYSAFNFSNRQQSFVSTLLVRLGLLISYAQVEVFVIIISLSVNISIPCADQLDNQKISVNQPLPCDYDLVLHRVLSPGELFLVRLTVHHRGILLALDVDIDDLPILLYPAGCSDMQFYGWPPNNSLWLKKRLECCFSFRA